MAKFVVFEQFILTLRVSDDLPENVVEETTECLGSDLFRTRLSKAVRKVISEFPALAGMRVTVSR
ncbi:hypothetical protein [Zavarzinella formosa]|uniref:hypothetical protein n=1 Tax=Zavarzinella formosa TaxID=360055 RepID=UPI0002FFBF8B|nr:hypothetical protein [Zavarzinella formosa]